MKRLGILTCCIGVVALLLSCNKEPIDTINNGDNFANLSVYKENVIGTIYNAQTNSVAYNRPDGNGYYKIYIADYDGGNEVQLTHPDWPTNRHQWAEEWDPTGQYLYCYIEKEEYVTENDHNRIPEDAIPGYGAYTDLWIITRDGSQTWQITNFPNDYDYGICHGAISQDGTMFAWTERIQAPVFLDNNLMAGAYVFKVADVTMSPQPTLSNIRVFQPGGLLAGGEVESISNNKTDILVYSTFESQSIFETPIYRINIATGETTKLTTQSFAQAPTYTPNGEHIVYMTGQDCDIFPGQLQGADWWIMDTDGSNKRRLTFMNKWNHVHAVNTYRLGGSLSFVNDSTFLGGVMTQSLGLTGYTAKVQF